MQQSTLHAQKKPVCTRKKRALFARERARRTRKRALNTRERALYTRKRNLHSRKEALNTLKRLKRQKSPTHTLSRAKEPLYTRQGVLCTLRKTCTYSSSTTHLKRLVHHQQEQHTENDLYKHNTQIFFLTNMQYSPMGWLR